MFRLNYHHLYYFWAVARTGNLTRTAEQLHVSQSALSTQIRQLETQVGQALFERQGRSLSLTEAGRIALDYANEIFSQGEELLATLNDGRFSSQRSLKIGSVTTLSRNFQQEFLRPLLQRDDLHLVLQSATLSELLSRLSEHLVDIILSNRSVRPDAQHPWLCRRIARHPVSLIGPPRSDHCPFQFPRDLGGLSLILPGPESEMRMSFDLQWSARDWGYQVLAEVDDMAMMRALARVAPAAVVVSRVVVRDELESGFLQEYCRLPNLYEDFFAITIKRQYEKSIISDLLKRASKWAEETIEKTE
jgi:LysR family transcriptional activator of nhaA